MIDQKKIRHVRRADFVSRHSESFEKVDAVRVPGSAEERDRPRRTIVPQFYELLVRELEFDEDGHEILQRLLTKAWFSKDVLLIHLAEFSLLEFDCIDASIYRGINQLPGDGKVSVVIDASLGDDVARLVRPYATIPNTNMCPGHEYRRLESASESSASTVQQSVAPEPYTEIHHIQIRSNRRPVSTKTRSVRDVFLVEERERLNSRLNYQPAEGDTKRSRCCACDSVCRK